MSHFHIIDKDLELIRFDFKQNTWYLNLKQGLYWIWSKEKNDWLIPVTKPFHFKQSEEGEWLYQAPRQNWRRMFRIDHECFADARNQQDASQAMDKLYALLAWEEAINEFMFVALKDTSSP